MPVVLHSPEPATTIDSRRIYQQVISMSRMMRFWVVALLAVTTLEGAAQFTYVTNHGSITITRYTGPSNAVVVIPGTITGLPVTSIGNAAFSDILTRGNS
jgi:hypothetical protein